MNTWLLPTLSALLLYGFWGFLPKLSVNYIDPKSALFFQVFGGLFAGIIPIMFSKTHLQYHPKGIFFAVMTGVIGVFGTLFYYYALSKGKASVVAPVTAMYPIITIILSVVVLKESIDIRQMSGIALAAVAFWLLTG